MAYLGAMEARSDDPEVSVIVPVRNGAGSLPALLASLDAQTLDRRRFEVIVIDNDSSDGTGDIARAAGATVVREPIANRSRARNLGAASAAGPLFAFTDADCVARPGWLEALLDCSDRAPLVAGEVELTVGEPPNAIERFEQLWRFGQRSWVAQGWAATANLLVHREAFEATGGFEPAWRRAGEDVDFCMRARQAGFALAYCADGVVAHQGERELVPFLHRLLHHGYGGTQAYHRLGAGYRAWRRPGPVFARDRVLREMGYDPESFESSEWRRMARLGRLGYMARMAGSAWAELRRAR